MLVVIMVMLLVVVLVVVVEVQSIEGPGSRLSLEINFMGGGGQGNALVVDRGLVAAGSLAAHCCWEGKGKAPW